MANISTVLPECQFSANITDRSVDYSRYYWGEPMVKNHVIIGPTNLGQNMRYYWLGQCVIKYALLLSMPMTDNIQYY